MTNKSTMCEGCVVSNPEITKHLVGSKFEFNFERQI